MGSVSEANQEGSLREQLSLLNQKMDMLLNDFKDFKESAKDREERIQCLERKDAANEKTLTSLEKNYDKLNSKSDFWNGGNTILGFIVGVYSVVYSLFNK